MAIINSPIFTVGMDISQVTKAMAELDAKTSRVTDEMTRKFSRVGKGEGDVGKMISSGLKAAGIGAAVYMVAKAVKEVGEFDDKVRRLAMDSKMTKAEMLGFKQSIYDVGLKMGLSADEVYDMSNEAFKAGKSIEFAKNHMELFGQVTQATGASAGKVGEFMGDIYEKTGLTGDALRDVAGALNAFGKTAGRESQFKELIEGQTGRDALKWFVTQYPKAKKEQLTNFFMDLMSVEDPNVIVKALKTITGEKRDYLKANYPELDLSGGISIPTILQAIYKKKHKGLAGDKENVQREISNIFTEKSVADLYKLVSEYDELAKSKKEAFDTKDPLNAELAMTGYGAAVKRVGIVFAQLKDAALAPAIDEVSKALSNLSKEDIAGLAAVAKVLGQGFGLAAVGAVKLVNALVSLPANLAGFQAQQLANESIAGGNQAPGDLIRKAQELRAKGNKEGAYKLMDMARGMYDVPGNEAAQGHASTLSGVMSRWYAEDNPGMDLNRGATPKGSTAGTGMPSVNVSNSPTNYFILPDWTKILATPYSSQNQTNVVVTPGAKK